MTFGYSYFAQNVIFMAIRLLTSKFDFFFSNGTVYLVEYFSNQSCFLFFAMQTNKHFQFSAATQNVPLKVKDMSLAEWGRQEIKLAEAVMPGLMALREEFGESKPLQGARIAGWLHSDNYENKVYTLRKHLDEKVARLHLEKIGVELETLRKDQADYIGVTVEGPFKPEHFRY